MSLHPNVFHRVLEPLPINQWQIEQTAQGLLLRIVPGTAAVEPASISATLARDLAAAGAAPLAIDVALVDAVAKTSLGKAPLIKALRRSDA